MIHADEMATVWVVRGGDRGQLVRRFLDDGAVGLGATDFPDGRDLDRAAALRILGVGPDDEPTKHQEARVALFLSFVRRMATSDVAMLIDPAAEGFVCGVVSGDYVYRDDLDPGLARHRRPVEWRRRLPFDALPARLDHLPSQRSDVEAVADGRLRELALQCCRGERGEDPLDRPAVATTPRRRRGSRSPRRPSTPRRAPTRPAARRRCTTCLVTKPEEAFEDGGDTCRDCL